MRVHMRMRMREGLKIISQSSVFVLLFILELHQEKKFISRLTRARCRFSGLDAYGFSK